MLMVNLAFADYAVVVGVQQYAPLVAASTLQGCINDAQGISDALKGHGFRVTLLTDATATRKGILDSLAAAKSTVKSNERFVFYFAGHGRKAPRFALMPSDATISGNDIEAKVLNEAILAIPARSRTVLLDSCFSGGMAAGEMSRGGDDFTSRNFELPEVKARSIKFGPPKSQGSTSNKPEKFASAPGICYYAASLDTEQALEATMDDKKRHGLFTYGLIKNLQNGKLWNQVHNDVKKQIAKRLEKSGRTQNPVLSTEFMQTNALDNVAGASAAGPPSKSFLDIWNLDNPNPEKLHLKIAPDLDIQEAGREIKLQIHVGQEGYLVLLGQVGNRIYRFYPDTGDRGSDARVGRGPVTIPGPRQRLFFDTFGADHVKAMLFSTPEQAEAVMNAVQASGGQASEIALGNTKFQAPITSRFSVAVSDSLIGGSRLANLDGLIKRVMSKADDPSKFIFERLRSASDGYDDGESWLNGFDPNAQPSISDRETFVCLLNLAIQAGPLYEQSAFSGVKLSSDLKRLAANPPTGEKLWKLNRDILLATYPKDVNPDVKGR